MQGANPTSAAAATAREPALQQALLFDPQAPGKNLNRFYRWGWVPLVVGCLILIAGGLMAFEAMYGAFGLTMDGPLERHAYLVRGVVMSLLLAGWAGWYVLMARKRIERVREELRQQQNVLAEQAWRAEQTIGLGALSRVLAHEIRSPLHSIALTVALLRKRAQTADPMKREELLAVAEQIESEVGRLDGLLQEYMEYANIPSLELMPQPVAIRDAIDSVVAVHMPQFERKLVALSVDVSPGIPAIRADQARIRQLLHLLVRNALESATDGGKVRISARSEHGDIRLSVWHDGPVVEQPDQVFRPFFGGRDGSSGLALAIVRDVIRAHGGDVAARGGAEGGLEISLRLPREHA